MNKGAFLIVLLSGAAWAQSTPKPAEDKAASPPPQQPQRSLNLKLDDPARYTREEPASKGGDNLPSLGGNSNSTLWDKAQRDLRPDSPANPYPKDTQRLNQ
jgi:hypothetical protein